MAGWYICYREGEEPVMRYALESVEGTSPMDFIGKISGPRGLTLSHRADRIFYLGEDGSIRLVKDRHGRPRTLARGLVS